MTKKIIKIQSNNKNLEARIWIPENYKNAIIITHSWRNNMDDPICFEAAEAFYNKNYLVLQVNLVGHGKSEGKLRDLSYQSMINNINSSFDYIKQNYDFEKIIGMGISLGSVAIAFSKVNFAAQILLSYNPIINPKYLYERYKIGIHKKEEELNKEGFITLNSVTGRGQFEMSKEWSEEMKYQDKEFLQCYIDNPVDTLLVQGTADHSYNAERFNNFLKIKKVDHLEIPGADHNFSNKDHRVFIINQIFEWLQNILIIK